VKRALQVGGVLVALLAVVAISLPFLVNANEFRPRIQVALSSALGRQVTLGDLKFSLFSGSLTARDLSVADDAGFSTSPFLRAQSLDLGVSVWPLVTARELNVTDLTINGAEIALLQNAAGGWNFATAGAKAPGRGPKAGGNSAPALSVKLITISNSRISIGRLGTRDKPIVFENVNIAVKEFAPGARFPFSLTGKLAPAGDIKVDGTAGPINSTDASMTPVQLNLNVSGVDVAAAGIAADSGIAGLLSVTSTASTDGTTLDSRGAIHLDHAKFVREGTPAKEPVEFDFALRHNLANRTGALSQGDIRLGQAHASLTGTYAQSATTTTLNFRLAGTAMPINALTGMLPALDLRLPERATLEGGTASINVAITGPVADPVVAGAVGLNDTKLKGFDLGSQLSSVERIAGIHSSPDTVIQTLSATLRSDAAGKSIQQLKFVAPSIGEVDGAGTISAKHDLDFKMRATVRGQTALATALGSSLGSSSIPFFVQGTATNPVIKPDVAGLAASQIDRLGGKKIGGVDAGQVLNGLFGGKRKN
jgi:AsmA protein